MYQKSFLGENDELKDNIFDKQFTLRNITHEKIQKYVFIQLLYDLSSNIFCGYLCR